MEGVSTWPRVFLIELGRSGKALVLHFTQHGAQRIGLRKLLEAEEINKGGWGWGSFHMNIIRIFLVSLQFELLILHDYSI